MFGSLWELSAGHFAVCRSVLGTVSSRLIGTGRPSTPNQARCSMSVYREKAADVSPPYSSGDEGWWVPCYPEEVAHSWVSMSQCVPLGLPSVWNIYLCSFTCSWQSHLSALMQERVWVQIQDSNPPPTAFARSFIRHEHDQMSSKKVCHSKLGCN